MPSQLHEALVELFRERPRLAPDLLNAIFGLALPEGDRAEIVASSFGEARPPEYSADLVLRVGVGARRIAVIVEVQLDADAATRQSKRSAWPRYAVWQWAHGGAPTYLVVVTPSLRVERWAAQPIAVGHPGFELLPLVLGPSNIPALVNPEAARDSPELAVLSAVVHGHGSLAAEVGKCAIEAALAIDPDKRKLYVDVVLAALKPGARLEVEEIMIQNYEYQSEYAKRYLQQGREEGRAEGIAEGRAEGILRVLEARGFSVPEAVANRVIACRDPQALELWLLRAVTVPTLDAVFE
jgi:hypothetical protein